MTSTRSDAAANAAADAVCALADGGAIRIYSGEQPGTPETSITDQILLAVCGLANPAFAAAVDGICVANAITDEDSNLATGTATWFRVVDSAGDGVWDGTIGTSGEDLNLDSTAIVAGETFSITAFIYAELSTSEN